jgi:hypothetical protein
MILDQTGVQQRILLVGVLLSCPVEWNGMEEMLLRNTSFNSGVGDEAVKCNSQKNVPTGFTSRGLGVDANISAHLGVRD